jgi:hypothetical protein
MILKYRQVDTGFCQVQYTTKYKGEILLYCFQETKEGFEFLRCSRDGEPSHIVSTDFIEKVEFPRGETSVELRLTTFLIKKFPGKLYGKHLTIQV